MKKTKKIDKWDTVQHCDCGKGHLFYYMNGFVPKKRHKKA